MVYCTKCGTENDEAAQYCKKCGGKLEGTRKKSFEKRMEEWGEDFGKRAEAWGEDFGRRAEKECFVLPHGGLVFGLIIGFIIILLGILWLAGIELWNAFWSVIIIIFGLLIIGGALYSLTRRR